MLPVAAVLGILLPPLLLTPLLDRRRVTVGVQWLLLHDWRVLKLLVRLLEKRLVWGIMLLLLLQVLLLGLQRSVMLALEQPGVYIRVAMAVASAYWRAVAEVGRQVIGIISAVRWGWRRRGQPRPCLLMTSNMPLLLLPLLQFYLSSAAQSSTPVQQSPPPVAAAAAAEVGKRRPRIRRSSSSSTHRSWW